MKKQGLKKLKNKSGNYQEYLKRRSELKMRGTDDEIMLILRKDLK